MQRPTSRATREAAEKRRIPSRVEYLCSWCGKRVMCSSTHGRPEPGVCPDRSSETRKYPHVWRVNRKFD